MKATGIVRRIDDLGRVVVPKEIRRTLHIREGDPLEIFTDRDGGVVLRKYSPLGELAPHADDVTRAMESAIDGTVVICDRDNVVSVCGEYRREYAARPLSRQMEAAMENRAALLIDRESSARFVPVYEGENTAALRSEIVRPILSEGQVLGAVVVLSKNAARPLGEVESKSAELAALFLSAQLAQ